MNNHLNSGDGHSRKRMLWGIVLIVAGCLFLLDRMDIYEVSDIWRYWPIVISLAGLIEILSARSMRDVTRGTMNIVVGVWMYACIEGLWGLDFGNSWPILVIAFGANVFMTGVADRNKQS